jgi:ATP-dependent DNA helicase RecG
MFDDRLEVESPGGLPGIVTVENIRRRHFSRNPHVVGVLKTWRYMEELGFGVDRVFREMEAVGALPPLITDDGVVTVTLYAARPATPEQVTLSEQATRWTKMGLNERQVKALLLIEQRGVISRQQYCELIGTSRMTAYRDLTDLVKRGLLQVKGSGRQIQYVLVEDMGR